MRLSEYKYKLEFALEIIQSNRVIFSDSLLSV